MNDKIINSKDASMLVQDKDTILVVGSGGGVMEPDFVLEAIESKFLNTGTPRDLTVVHISGIGNKHEKGINRFAHRDMVKRVIGGHWGWSPKMAKMAINNEIEAYNFPQGVLSLLTRDIASGRKGLITSTGLKTFIDPRLEGGKLNEITSEDLVKLISIDEEEQLFFKAIPIDVAIIRGTTADEEGNISMECEGVTFEVLSAAQAAYNNGGIVIAQVKRIAQKGTLNPNKIKVPGFLVNAVVVNRDQWQSYEEEYNPSISGEVKVPMNFKNLELNERKIIARRAAMELNLNMNKKAIINVGFGMPDGIANVCLEEYLFDEVKFTIEQGVIGGLPANDIIFGTSYNPESIIDQPYEFDFYHGGGLDIAFLGMAQLDKNGNVNVSKFGDIIAGCGGFIDISQNTKKVVFCGTFTAGGGNIKIKDGKIKIEKEGKYRKLLDHVDQITFSGEFAQAHGQKVYYVTERAVFILTRKGLELIEIAPGIDLEKNVLEHMDFKPLVKKVKIMDKNIFGQNKMNLRNYLFNKTKTKKSSS
jgi:propionate CoA-transferase